MVIKYKIVGSVYSITDIIRVDNYDGNKEVFPVQTYNDEIIGIIESKMLGVSDSYKLGG